MGIFSAIFNLLSSSNKDLDDLDAEERQEIKKKQRHFLKAATATLELVEGISESTRAGLISYFEDVPLDDSKCKEMIEFLYPKIEGTSWKWIEWEYWSKVCSDKKIKPSYMPQPWPDTLNIEEERNKIPPEKVLNRITLKAAKQTLGEKFPETQSLKKVELVDFLKKNPSAYYDLVDPIIREKWEKKKHWNGPTEKDIFSLLCETVFARAEFLEESAENRADGFKTFASFDDCFENDKILYELSKTLKDRPFKGSMMPNIPGLGFDIDFKS